MYFLLIIFKNSLITLVSLHFWRTINSFKMPYQPKLLVSHPGIDSEFICFKNNQKKCIADGKIDVNSPSSQSKNSESLRKCPNWQN